MPVALEVVAADCKGPFLPGDLVCGNDLKPRRLIRMRPELADLWNCFVFSNCICNQIYGVRNRLLGEVPEPTEEGIAGLRKAAKRVFRHLPHLTPVSLESVADSFRDIRRERYRKALEKSKRCPLGDEDFKGEAFVKCEKANPAAKIRPPPRIVVGYTPLYNLYLLSYLRPLEHAMYHGTVDQWGLRVIAKGLNSLERGELIELKWSKFKDPVCVSLDCSKFDKHVQYQMLQVEHSIYKRAFPADPVLQQLLDKQLVARCHTRLGLRWSMPRRCSGHPNTGCGNSCLACAIVEYCKSLLPKQLRKLITILVDGDDMVLFCEKGVLDLVVETFVRGFLSVGHELTVDGVAERLEDIVFCQARPVLVADKYRMVRDYRKVMSHSTAGVKHWNNPRLVRPMLTAVGSCLLAESRGLPVLQEYALSLIRMGRGQKQLRLDLADGLEYRARCELRVPDFEQQLYKLQPVPVSDETRFSFFRAFGLDPVLQRSIEAYCRWWDLESTVPAEVQKEWDWRWEDLSGPEVMLPSCM